MNARDLTGGERILLARRRRLDRRSQREAASDLGVTLYCYRRWEDDEEEPPTVSLVKLLPHEVCFIQRRRAGMSLKDLADALGVSRWWACKMEYGRANVDRLVAYWAKPSKPWRPTPQIKERQSMMTHDQRMARLATAKA